MNYKYTAYFLSIYNLLLLAGTFLATGCYREVEEPTQHTPILKQPIKVVDEGKERLVAAESNKKPIAVSPIEDSRSCPKKQKPFRERSITEKTLDEETPCLSRGVFEQVYQALQEVPKQFLIKSTEWPTKFKANELSINDEAWLNETWNATRSSVIDCLSKKLVSHNAKQIDKKTLLKVFGDTLPDAYETAQEPGEGIKRCFGSLKKAIKPLLEVATPQKNMYSTGMIAKYPVPKIMGLLQ